VVAEYTLYNRIRPQIGNSSYYNFTDAFQAKDAWVVISAIGNDIWKRFTRVLGNDDLLNDPRFADDDSRYQHREIIRPAVNQWVGHRTASEVLEILEKNRVPCGRVNTISDLLHHPQLAHREMIVNQDYEKAGNIPVPGIPIKLSETPGSITTKAPVLGEHNKDIYCDLLGYSSEKFDELQREGVI